MEGKSVILSACCGFTHNDKCKLVELSVIFIEFVGAAFSRDNCLNRA